MTCKTCHYLDVPDKPGMRRTVLAGNTYRCLARIPDAPAVPDSALAYLRWPAQKDPVRGADGAECPCWKEWME